MKRQEKIFEVENLTQKIKEGKDVILVDYRGLKANQAVALRALIKKSGGELQVVKNSLLLRALANVKLIPEVKKGSDQILSLEGPSLALFSPTGEIAPLKSLAAFGKTNAILAFKTGFFAGKLQTAEELQRLASLPSKEELQAKLVGLLAQPAQRLVFDLAYNLQKLVYVLANIKKVVN